MWVVLFFPFLFFHNNQNQHAENHCRSFCKANTLRKPTNKNFKRYNSLLMCFCTKWTAVFIVYAQKEQTPRLCSLKPQKMNVLILVVHSWFLLLIFVYWKDTSILANTGNTLNSDTLASYCFVVKWQVICVFNQFLNPCWHTSSSHQVNK